MPTAMTDPPRSWPLWLCIVLGVALCAASLRLREPVAVTAPASEFSAGRAMADVRLLGSVDHPIGSPQNRKVMTALVERMTALGLDPVVHEGVGLSPQRSETSFLSAATVHNVVGVLAGRNRALPAVMLMAHYDSVNNSPGAADDIANVATTLEVARLLKAAGTHERDVMFLFTDGEEAGLLGADAFFHDDPLVARVGLVINMETRGDAGRAAMFQTGNDAGELIRVYAAAAQHPFATSLSAYVYRLLTNDTDFTHALEHGLPGLNFAYIGDQLAYHTPLSTPDHLSRASVQNMGDQVAPVTLALADAATLPARSPDLVYFDLLGRGVVIYPVAVGWGLLALSALLVAAAWAGASRDLSDRTSRPGPGPVVHGAATTLAAVLAAALAGHVAGRLLDGSGYTSGYHLYRAFDLLFAGAAILCLGATLGVHAGAGRRLGVSVLVLGALVGALLGLLRGFDPFAWILAIMVVALCAWTARRRSTTWGGWLGTLLLLLVATLAVQALAPLVAPLLLVPLLLGALGAAACAWAPAGRRDAALVLAGGLAVVTLAISGGLAHGLFTALGPQLPELLALFSLLWLAGLLPFVLMWAKTGGAPATAIVLCAAGIAALLAVWFGEGTPERPALTRALYVAAPDDGPQSLVSPMPRLDAWERSVLGADGGTPERRSVPPAFDEPVWAAAAHHRTLTPPVVQLERQGGRVIVRAQATGGGRMLTIYLRSSGGIRDLRTNGRATTVTAAAGAPAEIAYSAPPSAGVALDFATGSDAGVDAIVVEQRAGWPQDLAVPDKPASLMHWQDSATTNVAARAALR